MFILIILSVYIIITIVSDVINPLQCVEPTEAPVDPTATTTKGVTPIWVTQSKPTTIGGIIIIIKNFQQQQKYSN